MPDDLVVTFTGASARRVRRASEQCGVTPAEWVGRSAASAWVSQEMFGDPPDPKWPVNREPGEKNI